MVWAEILRVTRLSVLFDKGSAYSVISALFGLLFAVVLVIDLFDSNQSAAMYAMVTVGIITCLATMIWALRSGQNFPSWVGLAAATIHALITAYFLGFSKDVAGAAANMQEMPLMAMYLAWFYPKKTARNATFTYLMIILLGAWVGPSTYLEGTNVIQESIRLSIFMALATELGLYWRKRVNAENRVDALTGAVNRRGLMDRGDIEIERMERYGSPLSLAVLDLDDFKSVNDQAGHTMGDAVLQSLVSEWKAQTRPPAPSPSAACQSRYSR